MRLGIDFGTTRIVVAAVDRGNYPVVVFECPDEASRDWFPPVMAVRGAERRYGWDAWSAQEEPGWTIVRSLKRILGHAGLQTQVEIDAQRLPLHQVLQELMSALRTDILQRSNLALAKDEPLEVLLGVPANANSNQRFLTTEAFRSAGFQILGMLNEPSAASIEFGHKHRISEQAKARGCVLVYDLGGGTFDASLVEMDDRTHSVLASEGLDALGGDDFDEILAELALDAARIPHEQRDHMPQADHFRLLEECRQQKEALHPNTRKIAVELENVHPGWGEVTVPAADFYERCRPLLEETLLTVEDLLAAHGLSNDSESDPGPDQKRRLEALYVTGGGSELPLVSRALRERFGRRVHRSAYARSATAIGLAIQADEQAGYVLRDRFTRHFGVWREAERGSRVCFDPLFTKGTPLPGPGEPPLESNRRYSPVHDIGHFRYLECSRIAEDGQPTGDITIWDEIRFPFDPALESVQDLAACPVLHSPRANGQVIEESYSCGANGNVAVAISNLSSGYSRTFRLARWALMEAPAKPGRRRRKGASA